jgi:hypothetical protein
MNPLAGLDMIFQMFAKADAFTKTRETALENATEFDRSASMSEENAVASRQRGSVAAGRARAQGSAIEGQQRLAYAVGSIDSSSGTAAQTMNASGIYAELDAQTLRNNAVREAFGHEESARRYRNESRKIRDHYLAPDKAGMSPADAQFNMEMSASALGGAASFGMGGGK